MKPEAGLMREEFRKVIQRLELSQVSLEYNKELEKIIRKLKERWNKIYGEEPAYHYNKEQLDTQLKYGEINQEQYGKRLKYVQKK